MKETSTSGTQLIESSDVMKMNRAERRRLGKKNGVKIMGSRTDHLKNKPHALTTFTGKKV